ncbi:MAG: KEOPS complex kinase/ATPase Bud32 [Candidatus Anstonellaceae archaeon]
MKGAEAVIFRTSFAGFKAVEKIRLEKKYRNPQLDLAIRKSRTKREARLLSAAKKVGVLCPVVYWVGEFALCMEYLKGRMLNVEINKRQISKKEIDQAAQILAKLHSCNIVHGDYTPANLMLTKDGMAVIDFGLGYISTDVEDKATDLVVMKRALGKFGDSFVSAYAKHSGNALVVEMAEEIEKRARYMERG